MYVLDVLELDVPLRGFQDGSIVSQSFEIYLGCKFNARETGGPLLTVEFKAWQLPSGTDYEFQGEPNEDGMYFGQGDRPKTLSEGSITTSSISYETDDDIYVNVGVEIDDGTLFSYEQVKTLMDYALVLVERVKLE